MTEDLTQPRSSTSSGRLWLTQASGAGTTQHLFTFRFTPCGGTARVVLVAVRVAFTGLDLCAGRGNHPPATAGEVLALAGGLTGS